jgi:hypothetical protein
MKNSITKAIKELERVYREVNKQLFNNELDKGIRIIIQTKGRKKKVLGYHSPRRWKDGDNYISEITLSAEDLNKHDPFEILIHECVHNRNFMKGISDCCTNQYHNRKFKVIAEQAGLLVEQDSVYGWCHTRLGEKAKAMLDSVKPDYTLFRQFRLTAPVQNTHLKKFVCGCGMIIRVARVKEFDATCNNCGTNFMQEN